MNLSLNIEKKDNNPVMISGKFSKGGGFFVTGKTSKEAFKKASSALKCFSLVSVVTAVDENNNKEELRKRVRALKSSWKAFEKTKKAF